MAVLVLQMLLRRCFELGARLAEPGEFTRRAFLNDRLDLAQAEAVADVIEAATETAARCAVRSLQGEFSAAIRNLVAQLIELRALVEATLDFPDEEIDPLDRADARGRLDRLRSALAGTLDRAKQGSLLRTGLHVVLAGQPNVGKSSLLNRLAGEDLAIVTAVPVRRATPFARRCRSMACRCISSTPPACGTRPTRSSGSALRARGARSSAPTCWC
jgi:tRNA modification GTPase